MSGPNGGTSCILICSPTFAEAHTGWQPIKYLSGNEVGAAKKGLPYSTAVTRTLLLSEAGRLKLDRLTQPRGFTLADRSLTSEIPKTLQGARRASSVDPSLC